MSQYRHWDPLLRSLEAPLRAVLHPLGFSLEVETNDPRVLECAESSFGIFRAKDSASLRVRLLRVPGATATPPWPQVAHRAWGDIFAVVCGRDNFLTADLARCEATGFFSEAMLEDREFFRAPFVECPVYTILVRNYLTPVHASCVVRDGRAICLCGPPAAGKTSLAYWCARAGYQLLSNDVAYLLRSERGDTPRLRGNPTWLNFRQSARELFPELAQIEIAVRRNGEVHIPLPAERFLPGRGVTEAEAGAVVFLNRGAAPALEEVRPEEAHRLLFAEQALDNEATMRAHEITLRRLVREGAFRLSYTTFPEAQKELDRLPLPLRTQG